LLIHFFLTARFRQRAAFDKDELLGCLQVPLSKSVLFYASIVRALLHFERTAAITNPT
jgi:hypothetical protein